MVRRKKQSIEDYKIIVEYNNEPDAPSLNDILLSEEFKDIVRKILFEDEKWSDIEIFPKRIMDYINRKKDEPIIL